MEHANGVAPGFVANRQLMSESASSNDSTSLGLIDSQGYRVALLLLMFVAVSFALERVVVWLENRFKARKGLMKALQSLKSELFVLGSIR